MMRDAMTAVMTHTTGELFLRCENDRARQMKSSESNVYARARSHITIINDHNTATTNNKQQATNIKHQAPPIPTRTTLFIILYLLLVVYYLLPS